MKCMKWTVEGWRTADQDNIKEPVKNPPALICTVRMLRMQQNSHVDVRI